MIGKMDPAQEIDTRSQGFDKHFIRMKRQSQVKLQERIYESQYIFQFFLVLGENHKIVSIANVVSGFDSVLHKLVELIEIDIDKELGGEVAKREPPPKALHCGGQALSFSP